MGLVSYPLFDPSQLSITYSLFFSLPTKHVPVFELPENISLYLTPADHMEDNNNAGSDSDSNSFEDSQDYYEPISAVDLDTANDEGNDEEEDHYLSIGGDGSIHGLSNGHCMIPEAEDGISSISVNGDTEPKSDSEEETESEIRRAFEEDERRRRSPLMVENAARVVEAMRAISFPGTAPDWASDVNEDRWIDQLRRLRSTSQ